MTELKTTITLHRGADTIGGSCIRISHGKDSIILDYGIPLMESGGDPLEPGVTADPSIENRILLDVVNEQNKPLAFIISHAHPDHYGLVDYVPEDIPVYISEAAKVLMCVGNVFYDESMRVKRVHGCPTYNPGKSFQVGPFKITAFLMDHSAFGACSILVEVAGKKVFYTGDFRGHGRKKQVNEFIIKSVREPDVMLMEGTTLDDGHPSTYPDEDSVEQALVDLISGSDAPVFVSGSGSNIDRIISLYRAAKRTGRELVIDLYQMYLLEQLKEFSPGLPPHDGDHLRVFYPKNQRDVVLDAFGEKLLMRYKPRHINKYSIDFDSSKYIFRLSNFVSLKLCEMFLANGKSPNLVYSMWQGYKEQQKIFSRMEHVVGKEWKYIHTSGHAYTQTLKALSEGIMPKRLIPVHTVRGNEFAKHFNNVVLLENGETLDV